MARATGAKNFTRYKVIHITAPSTEEIKKHLDIFAQERYEYKDIKFIPGMGVVLILAKAW